MTAPTEIIEWASGTPSGTVISSLNINNITYYLNGEVDYTFSSTPDLSAVSAGHMLEVTGAANASNNGRFVITQVDDAEDRLRVLNMARYSTTSADNETGSTGTGAVVNDGPIEADIPLEKQELGYFDNEYPAAAHFNKIFKNVTQWIKHFANGGAVVFRATLAAWKAITRTSEGGEYLYNNGFYRFDESATDEPGEGFLEQDSGDGRGILELPNVDAVFALLSNDIIESLPPVRALLDFASISANSVGTPLTVTVTGAKEGDSVILSPPSAINTGLIFCGFVSADNTVSIRIFNGTGSPIDPASAYWTVTVFKNSTLPAMTMRAQKIFLNLLGAQYTSGTLQTDLEIDSGADFNILLTSTRRRKALLADAAAKAVIQGSALANTIMEYFEGVGY